MSELRLYMRKPRGVYIFRLQWRFLFYPHPQKEDLLPKLCQFSTLTSNNKADYYDRFSTNDPPIHIIGSIWNSYKAVWRNFTILSVQAACVMFAFMNPPLGRNSHPCPTFPSLVQSWQTDSYYLCQAWRRSCVWSSVCLRVCVSFLVI